MPKKKLREEMRAKLAAHPKSEIGPKSKKIEDKLFALPVFGRVRTVAFFASLDGEVSTHAMIERALREGKHVVLPRVDAEKRELKFYEIKSLKKDTAPGTLGILEPKASLAAADVPAIECVIVPGLAFDRGGARLGRGAGYYDKFLAKLSPRTAKIGIGFSFQMMKSVPTEAHDEKLDLVLTD